MKTVIYHSADFDGIFCREIARKFLGDQDVQYIGWNFGDPPIGLSLEANPIYVMDLPLDSPFGISGPVTPGAQQQLIWIDHHKTSIERQGETVVPGYRIDGVAACRLAWQWFTQTPNWCAGTLKEAYLERNVIEPLAVRLAGEYDVWDKRDPRAETFQAGLRCNNERHIPAMLWNDDGGDLISRAEADYLVEKVIAEGTTAQSYASTVAAANMQASFLREWEGLKFLCLNGRGNSLTFASKDVPETGHDALLMFYFQGHQWVVSLYHAKHRTDLDLSAIAVKYGGGGHKGAAGMTLAELPFTLSTDVLPV